MQLHLKTKSVDFLEEYQLEQLGRNKKNFETGVEAFYQSKPPRMQLTNLIVKNTMRKLEFNSKKILQLLEKRRRELIDSRKDYKMIFEDEYTLKNWNDK